MTEIKENCFVFYSITATTTVHENPLTHIAAAFDENLKDF